MIIIVDPTITGQGEDTSIDPNVCHGKACIKGTRVMVSVILDNLAEGEPYESIASGYHVTQEDIHAAIVSAADLAENVDRRK